MAKQPLTAFRIDDDLKALYEEYAASRGWGLSELLRYGAMRQLLDDGYPIPDNLDLTSAKANRPLAELVEEHQQTQEGDAAAA